MVFLKVVLVGLASPRGLTVQCFPQEYFSPTPPFHFRCVGPYFGQSTYVRTFSLLGEKREGVVYEARHMFEVASLEAACYRRAPAAFVILLRDLTFVNVQCPHRSHRHTQRSSGSGIAARSVHLRRRSVRLRQTPAQCAMASGRLRVLPRSDERGCRETAGAVWAPTCALAARLY